MIDMASVYAERYRKTPDVLRSAVIGQSPDRSLDPYTALNALKLVNESERMAMAGQAQQPTSSPSLVAQNMAPAIPRGLGAMVPGAMGQAPQGMPPQGMPPQGMAPQQTMQAASGGLAGMYTPEEDYADGGIVAFQAGGLNAVAATDDPTLRLGGEGEGEGEGEQDNYLAMLDELEGGEGSPAGLAAANKLALATARRIASRSVRDLTPKEANELYATELGKITTAAGPSPYAAMRADITEQGKERAGNLEFAKGEALLQAASDVLEGNNAIRGIAKGGARFAKVYGEAQRADKAAKRSMANMEFSIADAERKERMGNSRAATAAVENKRRSIADFNKAELERDKALGTLATNLGRVNKPARAAGAGEPKPLKVAEDAAAITKQIIALEAKNPDDPQIAVLKKQRAGLIEILGTGKDFGPAKAGSEEAKLASKTDTDLDARVAKDKIFDQAWQDAKTPEEKDAAETALRNRIIARRQTTSGKPSGSEVNKNSTTAPDISTIKGAPAGSTIGKSTAKGWEILDSSGRLIGHAK